MKSQSALSKKTNLTRGGLSLVALFSVLSAVFITDKAVRPDRALMISDRGDAFSQARSIASENTDLANWSLEKDFAQKLSKDLRGPSAVGKPGSAWENLQFGALQGLYQIVPDPQHGDKIWKLQFSENDIGAEALIIKNHRDFLETHKNLFSVNFSTAESAGQKHGMEEFRLVDPQGKVTGTAKFTLADDGRVMAVEIGRL